MLFRRFWALREQRKERFRVGFDALITGGERILRDEQYGRCVPVILDGAVMMLAAERCVVIQRI